VRSASLLWCTINQRLDNGWHVSFGAGYNFSNRFSVAGQFMYNGLGVSRGGLQEFSVPDGNADVWSITAEPRINFTPRRRFSPYFIGGVGYYRRTVEFTQPALAQTVVFDPFFGFVSVTVQVNQVLGTFVRDGIGGSADPGV
jgi:opacity protein-like surface antigen